MNALSRAVCRDFLETLRFLPKGASRAFHALSPKEASIHAKATGYKNIISASNASGKLMMSILGAVAQFENDIRRERQAEGIAKAKLEGRYRGRKRSVDPVKVRELHHQGMGAVMIARELKIGRASVYRSLAA